MIDNVQTTIRKVSDIVPGCGWNDKFRLQINVFGDSEAELQAIMLKMLGGLRP